MRPTSALLALIATLTLSACAGTQTTAAGGSCPTGEERVCKKVSERSNSTGNRLSSRKVCGCEAIDAAEAS